MHFIHFVPSTLYRSKQTVWTLDAAHFVRGDVDRRNGAKAFGELDDVERERKGAMFPEPAAEQSVVVCDSEKLEEMEAGRGREGFGGMVADGMGSGFGDGQRAQMVLVGDGRERGIVWAEDGLETGYKLQFEVGMEADHREFTLFFDALELFGRC